jgi:hypothetical protein
MKNLLWFLLLGGLLMMGCSKDDEVVDCDDFTNPACSNYNPCHDQTEVSAEFIAYIEPSYRHDTPEGIEMRIISDTFLYGNQIIFEAKDEHAKSYKWKIGTDDRIWTTSSVSLLFARVDSLSYKDGITVQLIVEKDPNTACFPNDNGIDTVTRHIAFVSSFSRLPFTGTWRGTNSVRPDITYDLEIFRVYAHERADYGINNLFNVPEWCVHHYRIGYPHTYTGFLDARATHGSPFFLGGNWLNSNCPTEYFELTNTRIEVQEDRRRIRVQGTFGDGHTVDGKRVFEFLGTKVD